MSISDIEWTDYVWNPTEGCSMAPGSELGGCLYCYAARQATRNLPNLRSPTTGNPFAIITDNGPRWTGKVELIESRLQQPLHWKKPRRCFVNSMSDLFHESLPVESIVKVFTIMESAPQITFQILTKRAERMREVLSHPHFPGWVRKFGYDWLGPKRYQERGPHWRNNVWLGVSVENQPTADLRIPELLKTPAVVRFVSYEPALGPVDWKKWIKGLDWIIDGGESGPHARPANPEWFRSARDSCQHAGKPYFHKQNGEWIEFRQSGLIEMPPKCLTVEVEQTSVKDQCRTITLCKVGKKAAGSLLDGREWKEFPK